MASADIDLFGESFDYNMGSGSHEAFSSAYSSPAVPTLYEASVNSSSSSTHTGTVSPKDIFRDPMSAPNSTALTNLTSPSIYNDSPAMPESYEVSPMFGDLTEFDHPVADSWYPLFPDASAGDGSASPAAEEDSTPAPAEGVEVSELVRNTQRKRSSTSTSPASKPSGIDKNRKRDRPLPPIIVDDPTDLVALKRARNTLAARKSRDRKVQRQTELEEEIERLKKERDHWKQIALARSAAQG